MPRSPGELLLTALSGLILGNLDKSAPDRDAARRTRRRELQVFRPNRVTYESVAQRRRTEVSHLRESLGYLRRATLPVALEHAIYAPLGVYLQQQAWRTHWRDAGAVAIFLGSEQNRVTKLARPAPKRLVSALPKSCAPAQCRRGSRDPRNKKPPGSTQRFRVDLWRNLLIFDGVGEQDGDDADLHHRRRLVRLPRVGGRFPAGTVPPLC